MTVGLSKVINSNEILGAFSIKYSTCYIDIILGDASAYTFRNLNTHCDFSHLPFFNAEYVQIIWPFFKLKQIFRGQGAILLYLFARFESWK